MPTWSRRLVGVTTLLAFLGASLGWLPSPALVARVLNRPLTERFPCESHGCGCVTAARCWSDCCCYTTAERMAFARRVGLVPPAALRTASAGSGDGGSCCASREPAETDDAAPVPPAGFRSALGCRGLPSWLLLSLPVPPITEAVAFDLTSAPAGRLAPRPPALRPPDAFRRVPTPPPRA